MTTTPQSQARHWLRTVAREGARYIADLPIYDDEPYASLEAAACHYDYEHDGSPYVEEYIMVDPAHRTATLAVRWVTDGDYDADAYQGPTSPDDPAAGYGDVTLDEVSGVAEYYRLQVTAGIRAALALASERDDVPWDPATIRPSVGL